MSSICKLAELKHGRGSQFETEAVKILIDPGGNWDHGKQDSRSDMRQMFGF